MVEALLAADASPIDADNNGHAPLHMAMRAGHFDTARVLLESGASANHADADGIVPLWLFLRLNRPNIDPFVDPQAPPVEDQTSTDPAQGGVEAECATGDGDVEEAGEVSPPLSEEEVAAAAAAELGWGALLKAHGVDLDTMSSAGWTPLYLAAQEGLLGDMAWLLSSGAKTDGPAIDGATALQVACQANQLAAVEMLLAKGACPSGASHDQSDLCSAFSPLHIVCSSLLAPAETPLAIARSLLEAKADPSRTDALGVSLLRLLAGGDPPSVGVGSPDAVEGTAGEDKAGDVPLAAFFDLRDRGEEATATINGGAADSAQTESDEEGRARMAVSIAPLGPPALSAATTRSIWPETRERYILAWQQLWFLAC